MPVFPGPSQQLDVTTLEEQMVVGGRNVDAAQSDHLILFRVRRMERSGPVENVRQDADRVGGEMMDHEEGRREIGRKTAG
jgi:hypothetical protein